MASRKTASASAIYFPLIVNQINVTSKAVSLVKHSGVIPGGFPYSAYNGGAKLRPEAFIATVETVRGSIFNKTPNNPECFGDVDKLYKDYFNFVSSSVMEVDKRIYDFRIQKAPLYFEAELEHIGNTSSQIKTLFYLEGINEPIMLNRTSTVFVCNKKRVPKPPPQWWVDKFKPLLDKSGKPMGRLEFNGGDKSKSSETKFRVTPSDCDAYRHVNWSHYLRFCHDAFGDHSMTKNGVEGFEEFYHRAVRQFSIRYLKESSVGDWLTVNVAPSVGDEDNKFVFKIENEAKEVVCQSKIEYQPLEMQDPSLL